MNSSRPLLLFLYLSISISACSNFISLEKTSQFQEANPDEVVWKKSFKYGIAGVYNPNTVQIEWRKAIKNYGIAGVYNPVTQEVEWMENWHGGIAGVYNPKTEEIEWKTAWKQGLRGFTIQLLKK